MKLLQRFFPDHDGRRELPRLLAMMGLFFLVVCAVGILRPIKNALALDGLGDTDFYKVYLVSAAVMLFVPVYTKLADRLPWRWLIPTVALSFAIELLFFRILYVEGSTAFGLFFYGWYDLFAAALVTQFFMATQLFFNARSAKQAYPLVIAGGSLGATLGGAVTGFFSHRMGTPNLLLVAAGLIALFSAALPLVWGAQPPARERRERSEPQKLAAGELRTLWNNRQVRLIALSVLLTILVKQLVDYQFNTMSKQVFIDRDAISAFQGKFNAMTQWLPMVALVLLQPALKRWGVGLAVLTLPVAMLLTNVGLVLWWGLWAATAAKGTETALRYSTERAAREILYVPVPEDIKLKAKAYIDVAVEKGLGKVLSALLIASLLPLIGYRQIALVGVGLSVFWLINALAVHREYVQTLARSIEGRFASLRGSFASIADANTQAAVRRALASPDGPQVAFALDLLSEAAPRDLTGLLPELHALLEHPADAVREKTLRILARAPEGVDRARVLARTLDADSDVREAAVAALCGISPAQGVVEELLASADARQRTAALACLARGVVAADTARLITREYITARKQAALAGDRDARVEVALAAGVLADEEAEALVSELARDREPFVARAALHSAGQLRAPALVPVLINALGDSGTRSTAREALTLHGDSAAEPLTQALLDPQTASRVRRQIPVVLSHIPTPHTVSALIRSYLAPETDQVLDFRTLKALSKLRARQPNLVFEREPVITALRRELQAAALYRNVRAALPAQGGSSVAHLLARALDDAWHERREGAFRLLGLLYAPERMRDCHNAMALSNGRLRANAIEWLEQTIGRDLFLQVEPLLTEPRTIHNPAGLSAGLTALRNDNDGFIARLARRLESERNNGGAGNGAASSQGAEMDLIEKVLLLQQIDLLQGARSAHLNLLASIAHEQEVAKDQMLIHQDQPTAAMFLVVRGAVELRSADAQITVLRDNQAFGTWALIDRSPSVVSAHTLEPTRVLRIEREDFDDLLNENPELALGLLQGLARRVRTLVS